MVGLGTAGEGMEAYFGGGAIPRPLEGFGFSLGADELVRSEGFIAAKGPPGVRA